MMGSTVGAAGATAGAAGATCSPEFAGTGAVMIVAFGGGDKLPLPEPYGLNGFGFSTMPPGKLLPVPAAVPPDAPGADGPAAVPVPSLLKSFVLEMIPLAGIPLAGDSVGNSWLPPAAGLW